MGGVGRRVGEAGAEVIGHAPDCGLRGDAECTCPKRAENLAADEAEAYREDRERAVDGVLAGVRARTLRLLELQAEHGWAEPQTVGELRRDPRAMLCNSIPHDDDAEDLELAASLLVLVAAQRPGGARGRRAGVEVTG